MHPLGKCSFGASFGKVQLWCTLLERCTFGAPFGKVYLWCTLFKRCTFGAPFGKVYLWCTLGRCSYDASFRKSYLQCCSQLVHVPTSPSDGLTSSNPTHVTPFDSFAQCCLYSLFIINFCSSVLPHGPYPLDRVHHVPFAWLYTACVQREWTPLSSPLKLWVTIIGRYCKLCMWFVHVYIVCVCIYVYMQPLIMGEPKPVDILVWSKLLSVIVSCTSFELSSLPTLSQNIVSSLTRD